MHQEGVQGAGRIMSVHMCALSIGCTKRVNEQGAQGWGSQAASAMRVHMADLHRGSAKRALAPSSAAPQADDTERVHKEDARRVCKDGAHKQGAP